MEAKRHPIEHRRTLNVFVLAMLSMAVVISLRNLPLTAAYGLSSLFFYFAAALFFMIPYALVSAELASGWPKGGGIFIWVREALGDRWGFFAIWMQWFHNMTWYPAMLAFVASGIAELFNPEIAQHKGYLISVILIGFWGITFLNFYGVKTSAWISTICVIIGVIIPGAVLISFGGYWLFSGQPLEISLSVIPDLSHFSNFVFLAGIFLALSGLEANANLAREVKNPKKNYPKAIFMAAILTVIILAFGSLAIALVIPKGHVSLVSGLIDAFRTFFDRYHLGWLTPIIALFTVIGALGELNAWTMAGIKGLFATTEHGLLPPVLHRMNKKHVPVNLLLFQGVIVTISSFVFLYLPNVNIAYWLLSVLSTQMYVMMYILLFISGVVLRYTKPDVSRTYKVPYNNTGIWVIAVIGIVSCLFALAISFVPPFAVILAGQSFKFEALLIASIGISVLLPLVIYHFRKAHWQVDVLKDIREDIRSSVH